MEKLLILLRKKGNMAPGGHENFRQNSPMTSQQKPPGSSALLSPGVLRRKSELDLLPNISKYNVTPGRAPMTSKITTRHQDKMTLENSVGSSITQADVITHCEVPCDKWATSSSKCPERHKRVNHEDIQREETCFRSDIFSLGNVHQAANSDAYSADATEGLVFNRFHNDSKRPFRSDETFRLSTYPGASTTGDMPESNGTKGIFIARNSDAKNAHLDGYGVSMAASINDMIEILRRGSEQDLNSVLRDIYPIFEDRFQEPANTLLYVICEEIHNWTDKLQLKATELIEKVIYITRDDKLMKTVEMVAINMLINFRSRSIPESYPGYRQWIGIVINCIDYYARNASSQSQFIEKADFWTNTASSLSRIAGIQIIGTIGRYVRGHNDINLEFFKKNLSYFESSNIPTRLLALRNIVWLADYIPMGIVLDDFYPALKRHAEEFKFHYRHPEYISSIVKFMGIQSSNEKLPRVLRKFLLQQFSNLSSRILKVTQKEFQKLNGGEISFLESASKMYGSTLPVLFRVTLKSPDSREFSTFRALAKCEKASIRINCAEHLGSVGQLYGRRYCTEITEILSSLTGDKKQDIRKKACAIFHEVSQSLCKLASFKVFIKLALSFLGDDNSSIYLPTMKNFATFLHSFETESLKLEFRSDLESCIDHIGRKAYDSQWRIQEQVARTLGECAPLFQQKLLMHSLKILATMTCNDKKNSTRFLNIQVRREAMCAIVKTIRGIQDIRVRDDAVKTYWAAAQKGNHQSRLIMIYGAVVAANIFSRALFCQLFAEDVFKLSKDPNSSVRLRLASVLPQLEKAASGTSDLKFAVRRLQKDVDPDIIDSINKYEEHITVSLIGKSEGYSTDEELQEREIKFCIGSNEAEKCL